MKKHCIDIYGFNYSYTYEVGTLQELSERFKAHIEAGKNLEIWSGNKKVNTNIKSAKGLVKSLNNAEYNRTLGCPKTYYELKY